MAKKTKQPPIEREPAEVVLQKFLQEKRISITMSDIVIKHYSGNNGVMYQVSKPENLIVKYY